MYSSLYRLYALPFVQRYGALQRSLIRLFNSLVPLSFKYAWFKPRLRGEGKELIVSLTSFPDRIEAVWLVIECLFRQTKRPDQVILWLYQGEFPSAEALPRPLLDLQKRGLRIEFVTENLRPHLKYFYAFQRYPQASIVTVDDDIFYPPNMLANFLQHHRDHPKSIISNYARKIRVQGQRFRPYKDWEIIKGYHPPHYSILKMGVGGVFYPPGSLSPSVFNLEAIKAYALITDDLWLKFANDPANSRAICAFSDYNYTFIPVLQTLVSQNLTMDNILGGNNNAVLDNLTKVLDIRFEEFE